MFIYSNYSPYGFESPETLVEAIAKRNINNVCLVDDKGMAIPSFLKACLTYDMNVSFAISFSCFIEGEEARKKGYFISSEKKGIELIFHTLEKLQDQWISFLTHKELLFLHNQGVHCFFEEGENEQYRNYFLRKKMTILPVAFLKKEDKILHESLYPKKIGVSLEESEEEEWIKKIAKRTRDFLSFIHIPTIEVELEKYLNWKTLSNEEAKQVRKEMRFFQKKNLVLPLYALFLARQQKVPFLAHGDVYKSYMAYLLGIIPKKPASYQLKWDEEVFELSIVLTKKRQKEMMDVLKQTACIRHPLSKNNLTPKEAIKGAIKFYKEDSYLLERIKQHETLDDFKKRMRVYLLTNENQRKIMELAELLTEKKGENNQLKRNSIVFVPEASHFLKDEEGIYVDLNEVHTLSFPIITCHFTSH